MYLTLYVVKYYDLSVLTAKERTGSILELWQDVKNYKGLYQVSNYGNIKNVKNNTLVKGWVNNYGYAMVSLTKNKQRKTALRSRIIAQAFLPNPMKKEHVNHKDENKLNNHVDNLEWVTQQENNAWGTRNERIGLSNRKKVYCHQTDTVYPSLTIAAKELGVGQPHISRVLKGKLKQTGGYTFEYR